MTARATSDCRVWIAIGSILCVGKKLGSRDVG